MPLVSAAEIAASLGRDLSDAESDSVTMGVAAAVEVIESRLHRTVEIGQFSEKRRPLLEGMATPSLANGWSMIAGGGARVHLTHRPVASIVSVIATYGGADLTLTSRLDGDTVLVPINDWVQVTYVAGDDPPSPLAKRMVLRALTRELFQPPAVASGAYSSYSVEGSSFTANAPAPDQTWPLNNYEMRALRGALGKLEIR